MCRMEITEGNTLSVEVGRRYKLTEYVRAKRAPPHSDNHHILCGETNISEGFLAKKMKYF